jgi:hypothetical protein
MFLNKGMGNGTLVTALEKIDTGLAAQIKAAPNSAAAFQTLAAAMSNEGDVAKRTATMMAAFGRSGNALVTMLPTLTEELKNAEKYGNIIPPGALSAAEVFNDTVGRLKYMWQSFGDVIRGAVVEYIIPLITRLQELAAANRELIATKIRGFIEGVAKAAETLVPIVVDVYDTLVELAPLIATAAAGWKAWTIVEAVSTALAGYEAKMAAAALATGAQAAATTGATGAMAAFNAVFAANPIGAIITGIVTGITLAVIGMVKLTEKVGGLGNAFIVVFQTINRVIGSFLNPIYDLIQNILTFTRFLPGELGSASQALYDNMQRLQDSVNIVTTGSTEYGIPHLGDSYKLRKVGSGDDGGGDDGGGDDGGDDDKDSEMSKYEKLMLEYQRRIAELEAIIAANTSPSTNLSYSKAGIGDIWSIVRQGL